MFSLIKRGRFMVAAMAITAGLLFTTTSQAQTGTGDDISFLIPVIQLLLLDESTPRIPQSPLSLDSQAVEILVDGSFTNIVSGGDGNGGLIFTSSDTAIATVDRDSGEVIGIAQGQATITVIRNGDSEFSNSDPATFTVTVNPKPSQDPLTLDAPDIQVEINGTASNAVSGGSGSGALAFSSSDTAIATVDAVTGLVTGVAAGTAMITVDKAGDAMFSAATPVTYQVTVVKLAQADLVFAQADRSVDEGATITQAATGGSGTGAVTYSSSDLLIATVDGTGQVTGIAAGQATITAIRASDDEFLESDPATYTVTVTMPVTPLCEWDNSNWDECNWQ